jgi:hypothetical protein
MNYRIVKKYWRDEETAKVQFTFQVQHYVQLFWSRKMAWKPVKILMTWGFTEPHTSKENANFDTYEKAHEYVNNLMDTVPDNKVIEVGSSQVI